MLRLAIFAILLASSSAAQPPVWGIRNATVVDGAGSPPTRATVLISGDRITAIVNPDTPPGVPPPGVSMIDAAGYTLIPGLFDLHTHLSTANAPGIQPDWAKHLAAYLLCGVTTVADLGSYGEAFAPRRELLANGQVAGPHIQMAYRLTTPGGHGAEAGRPDIFSLEVVTPREARHAILETLPYHPDLIKIFTDGWRYGRAPAMTSMDPATLEAAVAEAHKNNLPVITHTVTLERAKDAARAKVDVLGHAIQDVPVDDELIRLFRESGIVYVPTMAIYEPRGNDLLTPLLKLVLEPAALDKLKLVPPTGAARTTPRWEVLRNNVARLHAAGIPIASGTDAGGSVGTTYHGWATLREIELLTGAGLTPLEAITAATGVSARALRVNRDRGTIAPGMLADLVLIKGSPLENIHDMQNIERVWLAGKEVNRPALEGLIAARDRSPIASVAASALLDDCESADGRSRVHTLWENSTDPGHDRSKILFGRILRSANNHALALLGTMSQKDEPRVIVRLPLQPGGVVPVDASRFKGVRFDVRGEGEYLLRIPAYASKTARAQSTSFNGGAKWRTVRIAFSQLGIAAPRDLISLEFEAARKPGDKVWLELDNVAFYR